MSTLDALNYANLLVGVEDLSAGHDAIYIKFVRDPTPIEAEELDNLHGIWFDETVDSYVVYC